MKTILFILIPTFLFAQQITYQDTIFAYKNKSYPCMVEEVSEKSISFIYANQIKEKSVIEIVDKLVLDSLGTVYTKELGYSYDLDEVNLILEKRNSILLAPIIVETESKDSLIADSVQTEIITFNKFRNKEDYPWSFGITYVPYYSGIVYSANYYSSSDNGFNLFSNSESYYMMSGQFSYLLWDKIRLTFETSYSGNSSEQNSNYHYTSSYDTTGYRFEDVKITNLFSINVGIKWYLKNILDQKVSPYIAINIGKQFASIKLEKKYDYTPSQTGNNFEDNVENLLKELNSPIFASLVFGVEYSFNESLSLVSNMQLSYSTTSATYKSRDFSDSFKRTFTRDYEFSNFNTKFGIGLNFYF